MQHNIVRKTEERSFYGIFTFSFYSIRSRHRGERRVSKGVSRVQKSRGLVAWLLHGRHGDYTGPIRVRLHREQVHKNAHTIPAGESKKLSEEPYIKKKKRATCIDFVYLFQNLFEQIWAANEYEIFKRMMIQKNLELQLQALNMIEQKYGLTPASLMYETDALNEDPLVMEEIIQ